MFTNVGIWFAATHVSKNRSVAKCCWCGIFTWSSLYLRQQTKERLLVYLEKSLSETTNKGETVGLPGEVSIWDYKQGRDCWSTRRSLYLRLQTRERLLVYLEKSLSETTNKGETVGLPGEVSIWDYKQRRDCWSTWRSLYLRLQTRERLLVYLEKSLSETTNKGETVGLPGEVSIWDYKQRRDCWPTWRSLYLRLQTKERLLAYLEKSLSETTNKGETVGLPGEVSIWDYKQRRDCWSTWRSLYLRLQTRERLLVYLEKSLSETTNKGETVGLPGEVSIWDYKQGRDCWSTWRSLYLRLQTRERLLAYLEKSLSETTNKGETVGLPGEVSIWDYKQRRDCWSTWRSLYLRLQTKERLLAYLEKSLSETTNKGETVGLPGEVSIWDYKQRRDCWSTWRSLYLRLQTRERLLVYLEKSLSETTNKGETVGLPGEVSIWDYKHRRDCWPTWRSLYMRLQTRERLLVYLEKSLPETTNIGETVGLPGEVSTWDYKQRRDCWRT